MDTYSVIADKQKQVAPAPLISRLPQRLLSHPNGGALAVLAHVDRAWTTSFQTDAGKPQSTDFRMVINRLMNGDRIGHATDQFNAVWAAQLVEWSRMQTASAKTKFTDDEIANRWIPLADAKSYIVFGDPAVQIREKMMKPLPPLPKEPTA